MPERFYPFSQLSFSSPIYEYCTVAKKGPLSTHLEMPVKKLSFFVCTKMHLAKHYRLSVDGAFLIFHILSKVVVSLNDEILLLG